MRNRLTALLLVFCLSLFLTACKDKPKQVVGVIDTSRIYTESKAGIAAGEYLEELHATMQNELLALQEELQNNPSDESMMLFQQKYAEFQQRIGLEQEQVIETLQVALQEAMDTYRAKSGLEVLIEAEMVMSMNKNADVTSKIIATLDKIDVVFTPVVMPEPELALEAEAAALPSEAEVTTEACPSEPCVDEVATEACPNEPCANEAEAATLPCENEPCADAPYEEEACEESACPCCTCGE